MVAGLKSSLVVFCLDLKARRMDDIEAIENVEAIDQIGRIFRDRANPLEFYSEQEFRTRFRFTKRVAIEITTLIRPTIEHVSQKNMATSATLQTLVFLRFLASGSFHIVIGDFGGIHNSTVSRICHNVAQAICERREQFIHFSENLRECKEQFFAIANFPGVIGCIDCTHIAISRPVVNNPEIFRNRKGYFSINVQAIGDANLRITNIVCRWPGSTHDARILDNSAVSARFEDHQFNGLLLGDNGYSSLNWLLTPVLNPNTPAQFRYNRAHRSTRNTVERLFGVLKKRFPCLNQKLRFTPQRSCQVILAAAILHNIALNGFEEEFHLDQDYVIDQPPPLIVNDEGGIFRRNFINQHFN